MLRKNTFDSQQSFGQNQSHLTLNGSNKSSTSTMGKRCSGGKIDSKAQPMIKNQIGDGEAKEVLNFDKSRGQFNSENKMQDASQLKNQQPVSQWKQNENKVAYQVKLKTDTAQERK